MSKYDKAYDEWKEKREKARKDSDERYNAWKVRTGKVDLSSELSALSERYRASYGGFQGRYADRDTYRTDTEDYLGSITKERDDYGAAVSSFREKLAAYGKHYGDEFVKSATDFLDGSSLDYDEMVKYATADRDYMTQFGGENEYNAAVAYQKDYDEKSAADLDALRLEIDTLKAQKSQYAVALDELNSLNTLYGLDFYYNTMAAGNEKERARVDSLREQAKQSDELDALIASKELYYNQAKYIQNGIELASVSDPNSENYDPEFDEYARRGKALDDGNNFTVRVFGKTMEDNPIEAYRRLYSDSPVAQENYGAGKIGDASFALAMTEEEVKIYDYYLAKHGKQKAKEYLDSIEESVSGRVARGYFNQMEDKPVLEYLFGVAAGADQFASGIKNLFSDKDYIPASPIQMASGKIREDLANVGDGVNIFGSSLGQAAYDAVTTTSNMLPSVLVSFVPVVGQGLGAVTLGASAAGHAKAELINLGYSKEQANAYGLLVGASEAGLQYLLGGITKLGGVASKGVTELALNKVDHALARVAITLGSSMLSEGIEEGLQTVIEPWLKSVVTGMDFESPNIDEVLYSSLLGAVSALFMEGGQTIAGEVSYNRDINKKGRQILSSDSGVDTLMKLANEVAGVSTSKSEAQGIREAIAKVDGKASAKNVGQLYVKVQNAIRSQSKANVQSTLISKGMSEADAKRVTGYLYEAADGAILSRAQQKELASNNAIIDALREITNPNSILNEKSRRLSDIYEGKVTAKTPTAAESAVQSAEGASASKSAAQGQSRADIKFEVSETGRATVDGKDAEITGVADVGEGSMKVTLADGSTADVGRVRFASQNDAIIYETVANMDISVADANALIKAYHPTEQIPGNIYASELRLSYEYGRIGDAVGFNNALHGGEISISTEDASTAYVLGDSARPSREIQQERAEQAIAGQTNDTDDQSEKFSDAHFEETAPDALTDKQRSVIGTAKKIGVTVHFGKATSKNGKALDGFTDKATGDIYISVDAKRPMQFVFKHELTHYIEKAKTEFFKLQDIVVNSAAFQSWLKKNGYQSIDGYVKKVTESYRTAGKTLSVWQARAEMTADFVGDMLFGNDTRLAEDFEASLNAKQKKTFGDCIRSFLDHLKAIFSKETRAMLEIRKIERAFAKAFEVAKGEYQGADGNIGEKDTSYSVGYDYTKSFAEQIDDYKNGIIPQYDTLLVSGTPDIWQKVGFNALPVTINQTHVDYALNGTKDADHHIGEALLKNLPDAIQSPLAIIQSQSSKHLDRAVVILEMKHNGKSVICAIEVDGQGMTNSIRIDSNAMTSLFAKSNALVQLNTAINNTVNGKVELFYWNKKEATTLLQGAGHQLSGSLPQDGFVHSIHDNGSNVKTKLKNSLETQQFKRWFGDWQNNPRKASKIVNADGTPKVMYHGSHVKFTRFDITKAKSSGLYGKGFYFTDSESHAGQYGEKYAVYLNIRHPLSEGGTSVTREQVRAYLEAVSENEDYSIENYGTYDIDAVLDTVMGAEKRKDAFAVIGDINATAIGDLVEAAKLFNEVNGTRFDGIVVPTETVAFYPNQIKSATDNIGTYDGRNDDIMYSYTEDTPGELDRLLDEDKITVEEYGRRMKELRDSRAARVDDPVQIAARTTKEQATTPGLAPRDSRVQGDGVSRNYQTQLKSKILSESFKEIVKNDEFIRTYERHTNKETMQEAARLLDDLGATYINELHTKKAVEFSRVDTAATFILLWRYQQAGDSRSALSIAQKVREVATLAGQGLQIFAALSRLDPDIMAAYAQKELAEAWEKMVKGRTNQWIEKNKDRFKLTDDEIGTIQTLTWQAAQMPEGRDKAIWLSKIANVVYSKLPPEKGQSFKAWQRTAMLLNPKTQLRNILGNGIAIPVFVASDFFGTGVDILAAKIWKTGTRTTGFGYARNAKENVKGFAKGVYESYDDFVKHVHTKQQLDRFSIGDGERKSFDENKWGVIAKILNATDRFNSFLLEVGDRSFYEMWYINELNTLMRTNKVTEPAPWMVEMAVEEALRRTWQDTNCVTKAVTGIKNAANYLKFPGTGYGVGDILLKFTKTPANLTKAIYDFSPAALASVAANAVKLTVATKNGQFTPALQKAFVDSFGKAAAGTMLYILFGALWSMGYISGDADDDDDVAAFEKYVQGIPAYSIKLFGKWYSYDWAQPVGAIPAIVANFMENRSRSDEDVVTQVIEAIRSGGDVLYNQSFMKSLQIISTGDNIIDSAIEAVINELPSSTPTFLSQIASATDDTRRTTYDPTSEVKSAINRALAKIPGARNTLEPEIDVIGRETPNAQGNFFDSFVNPGNTYTDTSNAVTDHLYELYQRTGDASVIPAKAPSKVSVKGIEQKMTIEQRNQYQITMGQTSAALIEELMKNDVYMALGDEDKLTVIEKVYDYAKNLARSEQDMATSYEVLQKIDEFLTQEEYEGMTDEERQEVVRDELLGSYDEILDMELTQMASWFTTKSAPNAYNRALKSGDIKMAGDVLASMEDSIRSFGFDNDTTQELIKNARSDVKTKVTTYWKKAYQKAHERKDVAEKKRIERLLYQTGLYGTCSKTQKTCSGWVEEQ